MSENSENSPPELKIADVLFNYAIARDDIKACASGIETVNEQDDQTYIYELQILKIISIGVSINYLLENSEFKNPISENYWKFIFEFSSSVTNAAFEYSDVKVDYFEVIREKLNFYLQALNENKNAPEPASVIGPAFSIQCKKDDDPFVVMAGARIFKSVVAGLKDYFMKEGLL